MCGIAGIWGRSSHSFDSLLDKMASPIESRGPDACGRWIQHKDNIAFIHRRLSIQDLSPEGHQPMKSASGRYTICYNGEVYNSSDISSDLNLGPFRGHSDTEVILSAVDKVGLSKAVTLLNGMFAFALWDDQEKRLSLVRDRLGIKPLFFARTPSSILFSSQTSSFRAHPEFDRELSLDAIALYLQQSKVPAPLSIHKNAHKLLPGTILHFDSDSSAAKVERFWDLPQLASQRASTRKLDSRTDRQYINELEELLREAVSRRLVSDVPLGAFLSGGIDSSTVVSLMSSVASKPVQTFTIGTDEKSHDESSHARKISQHLSTEHTELIVSQSDALALVPKIPHFYDEPFADSSQIPTLLVSQLARRKVTVSLSGDGGDELFGGYNRHLWAPRISRINRLIPSKLRHILSNRVQKLAPETLQNFYESWVPKVGGLNMRLASDKALKFARAFSATDESDMYGRLALGTEWGTQILNPELRRSHLSQTPKLASSQEDTMHSFMLWDTMGYLPDDILTKVDRASMAFSLEARVPLLDHNVVEFAWGLPAHLKVRKGKGKWILRELLSRFVPRELFEHPKSGFGIPLDTWLRDSLQSWSEELLQSKTLGELLDLSRVNHLWEEHQSAKGNHGSQLWNILMLASWLEDRQSS